MNILFVCADFSPIGGSHSLRLDKIVSALKRGGHRVIVVTTGNEQLHPQYDPTHFVVPEGIELIRIPMGKLHVKQYTKEQAAKNNVRSASTRGKGGIKKWIITKARANLIPDSLVDWYFSYKRNKAEILKTISQYEIDFVFSCSMPNSTHLIGKNIAKSLHKPLILDIADPWAYIDGYRKNYLKFFIQRHLEKQVLRRSTFAVFSTEGARMLYVEKYRYPFEKTLSLVTGFSYEQLMTCNQLRGEIKVEGDKPLTLLYGGAILPGVRNPYPLIESILNYNSRIHSSPEVALKLYVDNPGNIKMFLQTETKASDDCSESIYVSGYIPYNSLIKEMMMSDVLVIFGNSTTTQLPGKIFDYLATRKHILYILNCDEKKDQVLPILRKYKNFTCTKNNSEDILSAISCLVAGKKEIVEASEDDVIEFQSDHIFSKLNDLIEYSFKKS